MSALIIPFLQSSVCTKYKAVEWLSCSDILGTRVLFVSLGVSSWSPFPVRPIRSMSSVTGRLLGTPSLILGEVFQGLLHYVFEEDT